MDAKLVTRGRKVGRTEPSWQNVMPGKKKSFDRFPSLTLTMMLNDRFIEELIHLLTSTVS